MRYEEISKVQLTKDALALKDRFGLSEKAAFLIDRTYLAGMLYAASIVMGEPRKEDIYPFFEEVAQYLGELEAQVADQRAK